MIKSLRLWLPALGWTLYWLGISLNVLVLSVNHGTMPVAHAPWIYFDPDDPIHVAMTHAAHLKLLGDWLPLYWKPAMASVGDLIYHLGDVIKYPCLFIWLGWCWHECED